VARSSAMRSSACTISSFFDMSILAPPEPPQDSGLKDRSRVWQGNARDEAVTFWKSRRGSEVVGGIGGVEIQVRQAHVHPQVVVLVALVQGAVVRVDPDREGKAGLLVDPQLDLR